jgi:subtilisin family serine protease
MALAGGASAEQRDLYLALDRQPAMKAHRIEFMNPLDLVRLTRLMELASGRPEILVGLIDGPVAMDHPDLANDNIRGIPGELSGTCTTANSVACTHGTFVAGVLAARRDSSAPAICPDCTVLVRPIFAESTSAGQVMPSATPDELAGAILDCARAGARVINVSAALVHSTLSSLARLEEALNQAASRGVMIVAAAGNQGVVGSTNITRNPRVIPVVACDLQGRPLDYSNLGNSISRRGLCAPGDHITSVGANGSPLTFSGTSAAAPFVTGAIALLWSEFPGATAAEVRYALTTASVQRRATVTPPLLDAWRAYQVLAGHSGG